MKKLMAMACMALLGAGGLKAADKVTLTKSGNEVAMGNGKVAVKIGSNGRVSSMSYGGGTNLLSSSGIYFDYTATANASLSPDKVEIVKQTDDYAEVLYSNTTGDIRFQQGYIMRAGVNGIYSYVIANGTATSSGVSVREARVCVRTSTSLLNGYVDGRMNGKIPSCKEMETAEKEENTVQDATYTLTDGSIYTKYNWAQYVVNDSLHGLMNNNFGVWNIACSHEWLNGGPMRQELTVHATSKSPITIQMLQGEHFGASAQTFGEGERKLYGPFLIYVTKGTPANQLVNAKAMASQQQGEWPFEWFDNELYPHDRSTVTGQIRLTTGQRCDSLQVVLAEPGKDIYEQGKGYIFWALTDSEGRFAIPHVRKGSYSLYAYATTGEVTDELEYKDVNVTDEATDLGTIEWSPTKVGATLWRIGENNRLSDGYRYSDTLRAYGLWTLPPASLTYTVGQSTEAADWYYAQTQNGTWTVAFDLDDTYTGDALLTASVAGSSNKPKVAVKINGTTKANWTFSNDASIYRSGLLGGKHTVQTCTFPASLLKKGKNKVELTMSGISRNGGVMWDCIKLEATPSHPSGITQLDGDAAAPVEVYSLGGVRLGSYASLDEASRNHNGIYVCRKNGKATKVVF